MHPNDNHHQGKHQHKPNDKDCDCCKKHGNYVIKENIKPATVDLQAPQLAALIQQFNYITVAKNYSPVYSPELPYGKAPPGISGKFISIKLRSLQI